MLIFIFILAEQFIGLYERLKFLSNLDIDTFEYEQAKNNCIDLVKFVHELKMGVYFRDRLHDLTSPEYGGWVLSSHTSASDIQRQNEDNRHRYFLKLSSNRELVLKACIDLLPYQPWLKSP